METLKYCKVRKVKSPVRAHAEDAGIDLYFPSSITKEELIEKMEVTKDTIFFTEENGFIRDITLSPGQSVLLPSGLKVKIPTGHALILFNKSSIASKKHLHVGACVIDENYQAECHINLTNVGSSNITFSADEKLVQGIVLPINYCQVEEVANDNELYNGIVTDRAQNGFGSTDHQ